MDNNILMVYMLAICPLGKRVMVKASVPVISLKLPNFDIEISSVLRKMKERSYTVLGSFLETDSAACNVKLESCMQIYL
ncbi:hypothetical protein [Polaromonas sp.]|uniref:hypothetical protein n=1 Tax=Polaromonas sp. TaxID=1869339 RepID=UPI003BB5978A